RVALVSTRAGPFDEELVRSTVADARDEARPVPSAVVDQPARLILRPRVEIAADVHRDRGRRPDAKRHPLTGNDVAAHGGLFRDVVLGCRHDRCPSPSARTDALSRPHAHGERLERSIFSPPTRVIRARSFPESSRSPGTVETRPSANSSDTHPV